MPGKETVMLQFPIQSLSMIILWLPVPTVDIGKKLFINLFVCMCLSVWMYVRVCIQMHAIHVRGDQNKVSDIFLFSPSAYSFEK